MKENKLTISSFYSVYSAMNLIISSDVVAFQLSISY